MKPLTFTVYGVPQPQGSMKSFITRPKNPAKRPRVIITSDNVKLKPWRQQVADVGLVNMEKQGMVLIRRPLAIRMEVEFYFQRPKSAKKSLRHKSTKPDSDKLCRSVGDALTGICYEDDSQICEWVIAKYFDVTPRTCVRLTVLSEVDVKSILDQPLFRLLEAS